MKMVWNKLFLPSENTKQHTVILYHHAENYNGDYLLYLE